MFRTLEKNMPGCEVKCNSFVFFDIESTGIPFREADGGKTQITEISFICVSREMMEKVHHELPRKQPKITMNFNPLKMIPDEVIGITGLNNSMLEDESPFDEKKAALIRSWLDNCKPPVCLIAHNGNRFDFPLLKEESLKFPNMIPENTRCADSLLAFQDLCYRPDVDENALTFNPFLSEIDIKLIEAAENIEKEYAMKTELEAGIDKIDMSLVQMLNETTPPSQKISAVPIPFSSEINSRKRKLFCSESNGDASLANILYNRSFSLINVYARIHGRKPECSHRAEDDTQTLMKCALKFGKPILDWFDRNSKDYRDIKPTYYCQ